MQKTSNSKSELNCPSIWIFVSLSFGIILGRFFHLFLYFPFLLSLSGLGSAYVFSRLKKPAVSDRALLAAFLFLGWFLISPYSKPLPAGLFDKNVVLIGDISSSIRASGIYNSYRADNVCIVHPVRKQHSRGKMPLALRENNHRLKSVVFSNGVNKNGRINFHRPIEVKDYSKSAVSFGDRYVFRGLIKRRYFHNKPFFIVYLKKTAPPVRIKKKYSLYKAAFWVREKASALFKKSFIPEASEFAQSVFLGEKEALPSDIKRFFAEAGTAHILAISGLHVGIIAYILFFILKAAGLKKSRRVGVSIILIFFYSLVCGLRSPVLRASVMYSLFALSFLLKRKFLAFHALALAGIINLIFRPEDLFSASFQLSFTAVLFILLGLKYFYPLKRLPDFLEKVKGLFFISLFANLGIFPLISYYFGKAYLLNILTSLVVIPYLGVIFYSLIVFFLFYPLPLFREAVVPAVSLLILVFIRLNWFFSSLSFSYVQFRISLGGIFIYYIALLGAGYILKIFLRAGENKNPAQIKSGVRGFSRQKGEMFKV